MKLKRYHFWVAPLLAVGITEQLTLQWSPVWRMVTLIALLFLGMKFLVLHEWKLNTGETLSPLGCLMFLFPWPGMRPELFLCRQTRTVAWNATLEKLTYLILGFTLLALAHLITQPILRTLCLLAGLSFTVHFGLLGLLTLLYRKLGWRVSEPFYRPFQSPTLADFWSKHWNRPFTEMLVWIVVRPLKKRFNQKTLVLLSFFISGLLHEVAITLPIRAAFGLPTLYFLLQGGAVLLESKLLTQCSPVGRRLFLWLMLLVPLPLAFPPAFISRVLHPLAGIPAPLLP